MTKTTCGVCGAATRDDRTMCDDDVRLVDARLQAVPGILAELATTISRQDRAAAGATARRVSDERPLPVNLHAVQVRDRLAEAVLIWAGARDRDVSLAAAQLRRNLAAAVRDPSAPARANALHDRIADALRAMDRRDRPMWPYGACDRCNTRLEAPAGADVVQCPACQHVHDGPVKAAAVRLELNAAHVTLSEAAAILAARHGKHSGRLHARLRQWAHRKRIVPTAGQWYVLGDIEDVLLDADRRMLATKANRNRQARAQAAKEAS